MIETEFSHRGVRVTVCRESGSEAPLTTEELDYYMGDMQAAFPGRKLESMTVAILRNGRVSIDVTLVPLTHREMQRPARFRRIC